MGSFKDEAYDKLDYLSQLTEIVVSPQNELLASIPERIDLEFKDVIAYGVSGWNYKHALELSAVDVFRQFVSQKAHITTLAKLQENFEFEFSDDFELNIAESKMTGTLALVKKVHQLDDKRLLNGAVKDGIRKLDRYSWAAKRIKERTITVLNTLEPGAGLKWASNLDGRIAYSAKEEIAALYEHVILENKWRIRDCEVIVKMAEWINDYMNDEPNNKGLVNLMKLKFMIDKDLPVYSIGEIKGEVKNDIPA